MNFSQDQIFYASLWWMAALPGGADHAELLCQRYGRAPVKFPDFEITREKLKYSWQKDRKPEQDKLPPYPEQDDPQFKEKLEAYLDQALAQGEKSREEFNKKADAEINAPIPADKLDLFFNALFELLKRKTDVLHPDTSSRSSAYIELRQSFATTTDYFPFSQEIEVAIAIADIRRGLLPQKIGIYLHDDGQIFVPKGRGQGMEMVSFEYPGRPLLFLPHSNLKPEDMNHCPRLDWETLYRVVPLKPGQKYQSGYIAVNGNRCFRESVAHEGEVLVFGNNDVPNVAMLESLTDEEIINGHPALTGSLATRQKEYEDGYSCPIWKSRIYKTDKPGIVRHVLPDLPYMVVKEHTQLFYGSSYVIANPGDYIIRESENSPPRVIKRDSIISGKVRFIFKPDGKPGLAPGMN